MHRIQFATVFAALTMAATSASAEYIDFSSSTFSAAHGQSSYTYTSPGGTELKLTPGGLNAKLDWESGDGFGVKTWGDYESDEIGGSESLTIKFTNPTYLDQVFLTDLFKESGYLEIGYYSLSGGTTVKFVADASQLLGSSNGQKTLNIGASVTSIKFTAPGQTLLGQNHEFAVAGLNIGSAQAVPELDPAPASSAFALLVAAGLVMHSRRRKTAAV
jgi:MYXO-CTERM domain-containing protein